MKRIISELGILAESLLICLPGPEAAVNIPPNAERFNPNPEVPDSSSESPLPPN